MEHNIRVVDLLASEMTNKIYSRSYKNLGSVKEFPFANSISLLNVSDYSLAGFSWWKQQNCYDR
jgi:hypothetical protein